MRNRLFYLVFLTIYPLVISSQVYYNRTYDFGIIDHPIAFVSDQAGNVIVCGWFEDAYHENQRAFALKVNMNGDEVWRISIDDPSKYMALCITESGNIALSGCKNDHCFLSLVNSESGEEIWSYQDNISEGFWFGSVNEITNGTEFRLHAAKTTNFAHLILYYVFNSESGEYINYVENINEIYNPVFISGQISPNQIWFACEGMVMCDNYYGLCGLWIFSALHIAGVDRYSSDKGCVVRLFSWGSEYYLGVLTKTLEGNIVYGNAFEIIYRNFNITGSGIIGTDKLLATGTIDGELAVWFIDYALTNMYEKVYPSDPPRIGVDVLGLQSNDMVIMGTETASIGNETDIFLMKLDADGLVSTEDLTKEENIRIFPNPTSGNIYISSNETRNVEVSIFNNLGQIVKIISDTNQNISIEDLPNGFYIAVIFVDGVVVKQEKLIKK
jgi:hypothetical protein